MNQTANCPVCGEAGCSKECRQNPAGEIEYHYDCRRCGQFSISYLIEVGQLPGVMPRQRAILSHRLRLQQREHCSEPPAILSVNDWFQIDDRLPTPAEQANNLILWIGDNQQSVEIGAEIHEQALSAVIGTAITPSNSGLTWLLMQGEITRFFEYRSDPCVGMNFSLTFEGWQHYEALTRARVESRTAFMAMEFDNEMYLVVKECFKPAVALTGFELRVLTDGQRAGLIDDQLRVALRTSRFVIADLTHGNNGAYWEAGFAEGLGRPVIYTCNKEEWDANKSHFDTNHLNTIIWDPNNLKDAATRLTAMIRATFPAEAKMTD